MASQGNGSDPDSTLLACPACGFPYDTWRGYCQRCGRDLTLPPTEEDERQRRKFEAERAAQAQRQPPTRMERWVLRSCAVVMAVAGIPLLLVAALGTLALLTDEDVSPQYADLGQSLTVMGLFGVVLAVGLLVMAILAWGRSG